MFSKEFAANTTASPDAVWAVLSDVAGWGRWNAGIETIVVDGPPAVGTVFRMTPPGEDAITSTIVEWEAPHLLTDVTEMDGPVVRVAHLLDQRDDGGTTIRYRVEVSGAVPAEVGKQIGTAISSDFPKVIAALADAATVRR